MSHEVILDESPRLISIGAFVCPDWSTVYSLSLGGVIGWNG